MRLPERLSGRPRRAPGTGAISARDPDLAGALILAPVVALLAWWAVDDGGYRPLQWQPGTLLVLVLAAIAVCAPVLRNRRRLPRPVQVAIGAFGLYTAWSYLSVAWAGDAGVALEGAHRCTLYLAAIVLGACAAPSTRVLRGGALVLAGVVGLVAVLTVVRIAGADDPGGLFLDGRLVAPMGYVNADAAFWTTGALLAGLAAADRATPLPLRPPLLGLAALEIGLAVLVASRGWLFTLPLVLLAVLVLTPLRVRTAVAVVAVGVAALPGLDRLLEPLRVGGGRDYAASAADVTAAAHETVWPLALMGLIAAALGVLWVLADRFFVPSPGTSRMIARAAAVVAVLALVGGPIAVLAAVPEPVDRVERAWDDFRSSNTDLSPGTGRFSELGSSRYDFWRVAIEVFEDHPVGGAGQDNFADEYLVRRTTGEEPRWAHSLPFRALAHTGIVGAALLLVALVALAAGGLRRRVPRDRRAAVAIASAPLVVWVVHGSVDWFWEYPLLSVASLGLAAAAGGRAGTPTAASETRPPTAPAAGDEPRAAGESAMDAARLAPPPGEGAPPRRPGSAGAGGRAGTVGRTVVAVAAALAVVAVGASWSANRDIDRASRTWPEDPGRAFERLDRAARLTPSERPFVVEGVIAQRLGDDARARGAFAAAVRRHPTDWFARLQLGLMASEAGDRAAARSYLREAARHNPRDVVVVAARRAVERGRRFTRRDAERMFTLRARRFGEAAGTG